MKKKCISTATLSVLLLVLFLPVFYYIVFYGTNMNYNEMHKIITVEGNKVLTEFGVEPGPHSHIINGHVPVKTIKGERHIKADGKLLVIDGGFSKAYQPETGIAGYTLVYHSHGMQLVQHDPFQSRQKAIRANGRRCTLHPQPRPPNKTPA